MSIPPERRTDAPTETREVAEFPNSWSSDGRTIAFVGHANGMDIFVVNADGSGKRRLLSKTAPNNEFDYQSIAVSPDGTRLYVADEWNGVIHVVNLEIGAAAPSFPQALYDQLTVGGRLVLPRGGRWGQELVQVVRTDDGPVERASVPCRFVPLVGAEGFAGS